MVYYHESIGEVMPNISVNDISMYYEIHGKGEPLVFISGFGADHLNWTPILDFFAKEFQVILLCNRGAGKSDVPEGNYTILQMSNDAIALCDALNIERAHFVGSSMGGMIVQMIAHQHPSRVKSVVISNSVSKVECVFRFYIEAQLALIKANAEIGFLTKAICAWLFSYDFLALPGRLAQLIELQKRNPNPFTVRGYEGQISALKEFDSRAWIHEISVPTLILSSDQDIIFSPEKVKALHSKIRNSQYHCFKNNAHLPHIENPKEYFEIVSKFLLD